MKFTNTRPFFLILLFTGAMGCARAQNASFLSDGTQDYIRRQQLIGKVSMGNSLMQQSFSSVYQAVDSLLPSWRPPVKKNCSFVLLPVSFTVQENSKVPYVVNDGSMIPAAGLQSSFSAGVLFTKGRFSIQFKPEFVWAANKDFLTFPTEFGDIYWAEYYRTINYIDLPERFGKTTYTKILPGQSAIQYNGNGYAVGLSTENMWWGPGRYNALIMSNNAPGSAHITVHTTNPIHTVIGNFEGELIAGRLTSSGIGPSDTNRYYNGVRLYQQKNDETRFLSGLVMTYQPKWIKGLFLGFTRISYLYNSDVSNVADIVPLGGIIKSTSEENGRKASLGSLFARYVMPEEKTELYVEYGRNDKSPTLLNVISDVEYPRGYVAGFRKLFATKRKSYIEFAAELTQLELPTANLTRQAISWYTNPYVRQGFTNQGQILGSPIGPGSNLQTIDISWIRNFAKLGVRFDRFSHNREFGYNAFVNTSDFTRKWVDLSTTFHADLEHKRILFSSQLSIARSLNYQWYIFPGLGYFKNGYDVLNFHAALSVSYRL